MKRNFAVAAVFVLTLAVSGLLLAQGNPFAGIWKLNVAKSKYDPGRIYPKERRQRLSRNGSDPQRGRLDLRKERRSTHSRSHVQARRQTSGDDDV